MMSLNQISKVLSTARLKDVSEQTGVSIYFLRKMKQEDGNVPYKAMKSVSDFYEGDSQR